MDKELLSSEFEIFRPQLKSFVLRITASVEDTEDIVQDTFLRALNKLDSFREDSSLKTWIFSIASNIAKDNLRARKRWPENVTDICRERALANPDYFPEIQNLMQSSTQAQFEIKEHIGFCLTCISKSLPLQQQVCLLLKDVFEFKISEVSQIIEESESMVKYHLSTARSKLQNVFEGRCALINKNGTCHQCSELNGIFNPRQDFEIEKNKIEFVKMANNPDRMKLLELRLKILSELDPFSSRGSDLQLHHIHHNRDIMEQISKKNEN